jgi:hypothetical protein
MCPEFYNSKQYGGKNCTVELTLCVNNTCMNGATCRPYLISETPVVQQAYECVCQHHANKNHLISKGSDIVLIQHRYQLHKDTLHTAFRMNLLNSQKTNSVNVESGCLRQEQCFPNSCKRRGTCLDLWNKYKCVCDRPFHGTNCDIRFQH